MNNFESKSEVLDEEDVYTVVENFKDYHNSIFGKVFDARKKIVRKSRIPTLREHFVGTGNYFEEGFKEAEKVHPQKIQYINHITNILNTTPDIATFKQAYNEMLRLLYGKETDLMFEEPEANPDLLKG